MPSINKKEIREITQYSLRYLFNYKKMSNSRFQELQVFITAKTKLADGSSSYDDNKIVEYVLNEQIETLSHQDKLNANILEKRFIHQETITSAAHQLNLSPDQLNRRQREAINTLSKIILGQEKILWGQIANDMERNLPPRTYSNLIGITEIKSKLIQKLMDIEGPSVISIVGIGGIGKSAITNAICRDLIAERAFFDIIWIRAPSYNLINRSVESDLIFDSIILELAKRLLSHHIEPVHYLSSITDLLVSSPYLIVLDNFEFSEPSKSLILKLTKLTLPTKILITSRNQPPGGVNIYSRAINELSSKNETLLMVKQASLLGLENNINEIKEQHNLIYDKVGGNPLAIKLVIGLLQSLPLQLVLNDLSNSKISDVDNMYNRIFMKSWEALSLNSKQFLSTMLLTRDDKGGSIKHLQKSSGLNRKNTIGAIQNLVGRSLLEPRGSLKEKRYGIHKLTASFLQNQIKQKEMGE